LTLESELSGPLSQHLTIIPKVVIPLFSLSLSLTHLINRHIVGLRRDISQSIALFLIIHRLLPIVESLRVLRLAVRVEKHAEARDAGAAEDAEDFALVLVELRRGFAAEDEQVVAEEGLHAREAEVREARAVVEEGVDTLGELVCMVKGWTGIRTARVRLVQ
jgi:uncharacterized membrane protein YcjF (UPF0283 family)